MNDSNHHKPLSARPAPEPVRSKPTPVRELGGEAQPAPPEADVLESSVRVDGVDWTVRVLGRSGGTPGASPPLLLLGFWEGEGGGGPSREALVVGSALSELSPEQIEVALARAGKPHDPGRKRSFFEESGQNRRR